MALFVIICGIILALILHEAGHAIVMRKNGVEIEEFGIGIPIPRLPCAKIKAGKIMPNIAIHPLLLGAYVRPSEKGIETINALPYSEQALISGAGILANLFLATFLIPVNFLIFGDLTNPDLVHFLLKASGISVTACALLWILRYPFCKYAIPTLGTTALILLVFLLVKKLLSPLPLTPETVESPQIGGPIMIVEIASAISFRHALLFVADMSLSLALFNMIPLAPLDGGRITYDIIERYCGGEKADFYQKYSLRAFLAIVAIIFIADFARVAIH